MYIATLENIAELYHCEQIAGEVLTDPKFINGSGSIRKQAHHFGKGGLLKHTWEVVNLVLDNAKFYSFEHEINMKELFLSALFHDYGKAWDYVVNEDGTVSDTSHRRYIHHISRSAIEWEQIARQHSIEEDLRDRVTHNILSHHGRREWGSPIAPKSREAWILHLSDSISARVDDCDRIDLSKLNKEN